MNRLLLIDGNAMMHRAYHALPPLTTPDGKPAHVIYGMVSMIIRLYQDLKPTHIAVAFDRPGPTFRNHLFHDYQIQRPQLDDDFISQIPVVHETIQSFGIPTYEADGFEADDVIGTIAKEVLNSKPKTKGEHIDQVIIITGDRDILQLVVDDAVLVYMPTKGISEGKIYGEKDVMERMGVIPSHIPDLKALAGDSSDNYPGVAGIGPKTAADLINRFGSVQRVYKNLDGKNPDIGETTGNKLRAGKESASLSLILATIRRDAPVKADFVKMKVTTLDRPEAIKKLEELHFPSLVKRLTGHTEKPKKKIRENTSEKKEGKPTDQQQLF